MIANTQQTRVAQHHAPIEADLEWEHPTPGEMRLERVPAFRLTHRSKAYLKETLMPLISSPIDGQPMKQITRYGIEFDVCPTTGGIWLDKGELEKLITLVREEVQAETAPLPRDQGRVPGYRRDHDDDDDDRRHSHGKRKSRLSDLFDF